MFLFTRNFYNSPYHLTVNQLLVLYYYRFETNKFADTFCDCWPYLMYNKFLFKELKKNIKQSIEIVMSLFVVSFCH